MSVVTLPAADPRPAPAVIHTDIPARLDRLRWGRFHWLLVSALGVTWVLDGLEVTVVGAVGNALLEPDTLGLSAARLGLTHTAYLVGAVTGALVFGHLTDRLGRKKLFTVTLLVYILGAAVSALAVDFWTFALGRLITGLAIGGEYAAINSAIDELIPARLRGRVDLAVNGTFWLGAILGAGLSVILLDPDLVPLWLGWRVAFGLGAVLGLAMIVARKYVPESPRWLVTHGRVEEADEVMAAIEARAGRDPAAPPPAKVSLRPGVEIGFGDIVRALWTSYRSRAVLGFVLIASQAFFYNGLSFTFPPVLGRQFGVQLRDVGWYVILMAVANLLGPLLLGPLFDTVGRRRMIAGTYAVSAAVVAVAAVLFGRGDLTAFSQTGFWALAFFFASAAASAGYLTVSEIFPLEMRARAIALFYAVGTLVGGAAAPALFGRLMEAPDRWPLAYGYLAGAGLMLTAAVTEWLLGPDAEGKPLEDVAAPLSAAG
ncbi:MAG: MFS transporter [Gemmataceae bacterium]|nr:MFS transporter [Gemmataceae bacterium]